MAFWRKREKPLHEKLADGTGLLDWRPVHEPVAPPWFGGTLDVLHGGRPRQWDAVATADAPELTGNEIEFVVLPDGTLLVDDAVPDGALTPLADALEQIIRPPYRAQAIRRDGQLWGAAANAIEVVDVPEDIPGDSVSLAVQDGERTLLVDERPVWESIPSLEAHGAALHEEFALHAERLDGSLWGVKVNPL
jgi:hypothetical protein